MQAPHESAITEVNLESSNMQKIQKLFFTVCSYYFKQIQLYSFSSIKTTSQARSSDGVSWHSSSEVTNLHQPRIWLLTHINKLEFVVLRVFKEEVDANISQLIMLPTKT